jgi:glutamate-1-semialdehyde 2,1-aminomutase
MERARDQASAIGHGHSGMGTTLSANAFAMHAMCANLQQVMTGEAYARMVPMAERLRSGLQTLFQGRGLAWSVSQIGARCEFQFCPTPPRTGREAEASFHDSLEKCLHLGLLNRGVMITPFHNMMLVCPETEEGDIDRLVLSLGQIIDGLNHA